MILFVPRKEQPPSTRMQCREIAPLTVKPYGTYKMWGKFSFVVLEKVIHTCTSGL